MHPGFLSFFNTGLKVTVGAAAGYFGALAVSRWHASDPSEDTPPVREEHEDSKKKLDFEIQRLSGELNKREQDLKAREEVLAKQEAMLREMRAAIEADASKTQTTVVAAESDGVVAVNPTDKGAEPTIVKIVSSDPVVPPTDYVPRRPAVFDGGGNREPVVPQDPVTGEPLLLHFRDPSFATDGQGTSTPRDIPPYLADMFKRRRFTKLQPQHVVSFRATKDGWSLETPDGVSNGAYAPATEIEHVIYSTAAGATRGSEKGDATVVTLHGRGPKPPFDGKSAVSEAERNAFNEKKRILAEQRKAFDREKNKKEKELADKEKDLEVRKKFLDLREENKDDAADLFDLEERRIVWQAERFDIPGSAKTPNVMQSGAGLKIAGQRQPFRNLQSTAPENPDNKSDDLSFTIDAKKKEPYKIEKQISDGKGGNGMMIEAKKKAPLEIKQTDKVPLKAPEKPDNEIEYTEELKILPKEKPKLVLEQPDEIEIAAKTREENKVQTIDEVELLGKEPAELDVEQQDELELNALEKEPYAIEKQIRNEQGGEGMAIAAKEKAPYEFGETNEINLLAVERADLKVEKLDEMKLEALEKEENSIQRHLEFEITGKKRPFKNLVFTKGTDQSDGLSFTIDAKKKAPLEIEQTDEVPLKATEKPNNEIEYAKGLEILPKEKPKLVLTEPEEIEIKALEKDPYQYEETDALALSGKDRAKLEVESSKPVTIAGGGKRFNKEELTSSTTESGKQGSLSFTVPAKEKEPYVIEKQNSGGQDGGEKNNCGMTIDAKKKPVLSIEETDPIRLLGEEMVIEEDELEAEVEADEELKEKIEEEKKKRDEVLFF